MKRAMIVSALASALFVVGCGPSINPVTKARVDAWRGTLQPSSEVYHQAGTERPAFKSGQWAQYLEVDGKGQPSQVTYKIVGREGDAFWLETERTSYMEHTVAKMLLSVTDWRKPDGIVIKRVIMQKEGEAPQEMPPFFLNMTAGPILSSMRFEVASATPETVTVPAGTFQGAVPSHATVELMGFGKVETTTWVHGRVPVTGYVKSEAKDGSFRTELVAFGDSGAESAITDPVPPPGVP